SNGSDCNDNDAAAHSTYNFYVDADQDGFGSGILVSVCAVNATSPPVGYSVNNTDCNDMAAAIHPGQLEVPFNGIDDNCNGTIDEGDQTYNPQILPSQCGTTLAAINSIIGCTNYSAPIDGYRFKVVNTNTNEAQILDRNVSHFQLTQLANYDYATTYSISVQLRRNGNWLGYYGASCNIATPAVLSSGGATQITPSQCGITLPSISTIIATTSLQGVTGYRFRVTNMTDTNATNQVQVLDRALQWFNLSMLSTFTYGTTYLVEVAIKTNGAFSGFGSPCTITTPAVPTLTQCGGLIPSRATIIYTTSLNRVTSYRFEITDMATFQTTTIDRPTHWFTFNMVPGATPGGQFAVRVAVMTTGVWSPMSDACMITGPGTSRTITKDEETTLAPTIALSVIAYPSPYVESFSLDLETSSEERVQVKVYDMIGKIIDDQSFEVNAIEMQQFGQRYASGVYNVIVRQGEVIKTLRVIKR
ncbi:MAG: T9SS type A sorting domain-containing protein, partial [Alphaproteobacteria bacterium]